VPRSCCRCTAAVDCLRFVRELTLLYPQPRAAVPAEDLQLLEELEDRMDLKEARAALAQADDTVAWEDVKSGLEL